MTRSVKGAARRARQAEEQAVREAVRAARAGRTVDSFQNLGFKLGIGADNASSGAGYGFSPISRNRTLLEWLHRQSWLGGMAVDIVADDMTRAGVELRGEIDPADIELIEEEAIALDVWTKINDTIKWARLYGGAIAVYLIDGQKMDTPLRMDTVAKDQFKGMLVLDRWMVEPSLQDLVTDMGPHLGMPRFYNIFSDAPALPSAKIHYSRCIRFEGVKLPYFQRLTENMWGISEIERLYDRLIAFDSATQGAAQLVYKSYLRTIKIKGLREVIGQGGIMLDKLVEYVDHMRRYQSIEGLTMIDSDDEFGEHGASGSFSGLSDVLTKFGEQISGALQIPLVRLFGQSPSGLNSGGESELRTYYDGIKQKQERTLRAPVTSIYRMIAQSLGVKLPDGFRVEFKTLWQLTDTEKAEIANKVVEAVAKAKDAGLQSDQAGMRELRQSSHVTGIFTNITDEDIEAAQDHVPTPEELAEQQAEANDILGVDGAGNPPDDGGAPTGDAAAPKRARAGDGDGGIRSIIETKRIHGLDVIIETPKGAIRRGLGWEAVLESDYGYIRMPRAGGGISGKTGADGDQLDCFVGPNPTSPAVWVIDQRDPVTKAFDEHKVLINFDSREQALAAYRGSYSDHAAERIGSVSEYSVQQFRRWAETADLTRPASGWFNKPVAVGG